MITTNGHNLEDLDRSLVVTGRRVGCVREITSCLLLNNKISFNISSISSGLRPHGEATIRHRQEIGTRLGTLGLDYHRNMTNMLEGTNLTVSVQKLMKMAICPVEKNLSLLKDAQQE